jgi:methylglutamate dehydrogenase subunit D
MIKESTLTARAPFTDLAFTCAPGQGVRVEDRDGLSIATVLLRKRRMATLCQRVRERFGIELPRGSRRVEGNGVAFAGIGPEAWLATCEARGNDFVPFVNATLGDAASVCDQGSGYALLRMTGPKLRETLAKMLPLDLHLRAFAPGDVASSIASHVGTTLWRLQDAADGSPVFEIAVFRSLAGSFWHELAASAAEFGLVREATISANANP